MANPYTRFGYSSNYDEEEDEFEAQPEKSYGTKDTGKTKRRNPYTSFGFSEEEIAPDTRKVDELLDKGWSWEDIAKQTGFSSEDIASYTQQTRPDYGQGPAARSNVSRVWDTVNVLDSGRSWGRATPSEEGAKKSAIQQTKETGTALFTGLEKVGDSVEALSGITERRLQHWDKQRREGKITREEHQKLLQQQEEDTRWAGDEDKGTLDRLKKSGGVALEATSEVLPFTKASKLASLTTKGGAKFGAAEGLTHGVGGQLTNPDGFDIKQVGIETVLGGAAGGVGGRLAQWRAAKKAAKAAEAETDLINKQMGGAADDAFDALAAEDAYRASQSGGGRITDPALMLPDGNASRAARLAQIDDELDEIRFGTRDPNQYVQKADNVDTLAGEPAGPAKITKSGEIDGRGGKKTGVFAETTPKMDADPSSTVARSKQLLKERAQLVKEIEAVKDPTIRVAEEINLVDAELAKAQKTGSKGKVKKLQQQQAYLDKEADKIDAENVARESAQAADEVLEAPGVGSGGTKTSRLAERTEEKAIKEKLAKAFDGLPAYNTTNLDQEAAFVRANMDNDMDGAVRIAMGIDPPPPGTTAGSYYVGVANRAAQTGDAELIEKLATESAVPTRASRYGQEISALQNLDPESPITAVKKVLTARKKGQPKLPATITRQETERITAMSKQIFEAREAVTNAATPEARQAYGKARVAYDNYIAELVENAGPKLGESLKKPGFYKHAALQSLGFSKSVVTTLDNSIIGRQGWKTMFTHPKTWAKNSLKTFTDIAGSLKGNEMLDHVHADVVSRDNALNGRYKVGELDVYGAKKNFLEEAFPVSFRKVTDSKTGNVILRPFKASEAAFSGWQQRARADLFDHYLVIAEKSGVDITDPKELKSIGKMVNSLTSRGNLGKDGEKIADSLNKVFFSPRLIKSHVDVLGWHVVTGGDGSNFVRKRAARNLLQIAVGSALALKLASEVTGGKIEADPRSSDFGKLRVGDTRFDLTGGMASLVTLGSRLLPTPSDEGWAFFQSKSSVTGDVKQLNSGDFGSQTALDVLLDFGENKLSPAFGAATDILKGEDFDGNKPTIASTAKNLTWPLIIRQYEEVSQNKRSANIYATMIAEGLGISTNTYSMHSNWNANNGKQVTGFKKSVSKETFSKANQQFDDRFNDWYQKVSADERFWKLPVDKRKGVVDSKKNDLTDEVMRSYGYRYKREKTASDTQKLIEGLDAIR